MERKKFRKTRDALRERPDAREQRSPEEYEYDVWENQIVLEENHVRNQIVEAGKRLVEEGLVARTWGNISARISNTAFLITPSGRTYDSLLPEELVKVRILDCEYSGNIKPSSEKGVHAAVYALRPEANFVIHTHQFYATAVGAEGEPILMPYVPCASYGMPSTSKLTNAVKKKLKSFPSSDCVLMRNHGALCIGETMDDAFENAMKLEDVCKKLYEDRLAEEWEEFFEERMEEMLQTQGESFAGEEDLDTGTWADVYSGNYDIPEMPASVVEAIQEVYPNMNVIVTQEPEIVEISQAGATLYPVIDDLAQIGGTSIRCCEPIGPLAAHGMYDRNAVLIRGMGAVCMAPTEDDARAVASVLRKDCAAALYLGSLKGLNHADALIQRIIYTTKYSKQAEKNRG